MILLLIVSLSVHEAAHAWVAYRRGDSTAKDLGRLTLNPLAHIDPFMTVLMPALLLYFTGFIFGGAKPVPVSYHRLKSPLRDMMLVALAGPVSNVLLAILFAFIKRGVLDSGLYTNEQLLPLVLDATVWLNLLLAVFNMIPIPPLDGSRVMTWLLPESMRDSYNALGVIGMPLVFLLLILGIGTGYLNDGILFLLGVVNSIVEIGR